ncbi:MAG: AAA-like domain-containing protein, partial [Microcoleaceae cyanobacterium]
MLKTLHCLRSEGCRCISIDLTLIGSENITPAHWYNGLIAEIWRSLGLRKKININTWLKEHAHVSPQQRLSYCIEDILLNQFPDERIFIFIDEADTVLSLDFDSDDLFTFIRSCYNQRGINSAYDRLAFVIAGVAYPSDLIADKNRTPFNIGRGIALQGFTKEESAPLLIGLEKVVNYPQAILEAILDWTNGQPFLTQKLCQLVVETHSNGSEEKLSIPAHLAKFFVDTLVRSQIIENWENSDQPEHLKTIVNRLSINQKILARTLGIYQQILLGEKITTDQSREQIELILSGLIIVNNGCLQVKNRIYAEIFNLVWVKQQLAMLRPYSTMLEYWLKSHQTDNSRLLRGQSLIDAQNWIKGKSLSNLDYQFLAKSVEIDRAEKEKDLELSKMREVEARLEQEKKNAYLQKILLGVVSFGLFITGSLSFTTWLQYRRYQLQELQAITLSSNALFASDQPLEALVQAIKARQKLKTLQNLEPDLKEQVQLALQKALYGATEYNRLSSQDKFHNLAFSPDQQLIATPDLTGQVVLWKNTGEKIAILTKFKDRAWGIDFSPDGDRLVASSASGEIMIWQVNHQTVT